MKKRVSRVLRRYFSSEHEGEDKIMKKGDLMKEVNANSIPNFNRGNLFTADYFKRKGNHFQIKNTNLDRFTTKNIITGYSNNYVEIKEIKYPPNVIVFSDLVLD